MKNFIILLGIGLFLSNAKYATSQTLLYGEVGGAAGYYSLNLDSRISKSKLGYRIGGALYKDDVLYVIIPLQINYIVGKKHGLEIGAGLTSFVDWDGFGSSSDEFKYLPSMTLVYRFQSEGPLNIRIGINPIYERIDNDIHFSPSLSIGYRLVPK